MRRSKQQVNFRLGEINILDHEIKSIEASKAKATNATETPQIKSLQQVRCFVRSTIFFLNDKCFHSGLEGTESPKQPLLDTCRHSRAKQKYTVGRITIKVQLIMIYLLYFFFYNHHLKNYSVQKPSSTYETR
jgi:hypothetical protein